MPGKLGLFGSGGARRGADGCGWMPTHSPPFKTSADRDGLKLSGFVIVAGAAVCGVVYRMRATIVSIELVFSKIGMAMKSVGLRVG